MTLDRFFVRFPVFWVLSFGAIFSTPARSSPLSLSLAFASADGSSFFVSTERLLEAVQSNYDPRCNSLNGMVNETTLPSYGKFVRSPTVGLFNWTIGGNVNSNDAINETRFSITTLDAEGVLQVYSDSSGDYHYLGCLPDAMDVHRVPYVSWMMFFFSPRKTFVPLIKKAPLSTQEVGYAMKDRPHFFLSEPDFPISIDLLTVYNSNLPRETVLTPGSVANNYAKTIDEFCAIVSREGEFYFVVVGKLAVPFFDAATAIESYEYFDFEISSGAIPANCSLYRGSFEDVAGPCYVSVPILARVLGCEDSPPGEPGDSPPGPTPSEDESNAKTDGNGNGGEDDTAGGKKNSTAEGDDGSTNVTFKKFRYDDFPKSHASAYVVTALVLVIGLSACAFVFLVKYDRLYRTKNVEKVVVTSFYASNHDVDRVIGENDLEYKLKVTKRL
jgi:hypothetical protein